ncbi:MAG: hypothetical protein JWQ74_1012 [Marmoricola sp.]|nr:hypothetical protein [Marmoricola sp.]
MRMPQNKLIVPSIILATGIALAPMAVQAAITGTKSASGSGTARCPSGYQATGGGFKMASNSYSNLFSTEYFVTSSSLGSTTSWTATGYKISGTYSSSNGWRYSKSNYSPSVTVVCVK